MLFAFFTFWTTTLAAGAGAVSIPIVIHLLNRRRYRIVTWAAMRFLLAAQKRNARKMRIEQLILLLVRCLAMFLLAFSMASVMPWAEEVWAYVWPEGSGAIARAGARTHHVIVLDGSLSMNLMGEGGRPIFEKARELAIRKILDAPPGDAFSVLLLKDTPTWIVGEASYDARRVAGEVERLHAGHGNAAVGSMLGMISARLDEAANRFPSQAVYFFTDMQAATWQTLLSGAPSTSADSEQDPAQQIQRRAATAFVDVGREDVVNLAVTDLTLGSAFVTTGAIVPIQATVQNFGSQLKSNLRIELLVGQSQGAGRDEEFSTRVVAQEQRDIRAGERLTANFTYTFPSPGTYVVQVRIEQDDLALDDIRSAVVTVKDTVPVLLVNGKPAPDRFDRATEYLRFALNPFPPGSEPRYAPLRPKVVSIAQFADLTDVDLANYECIFLCDVPQFGTGELRRLQTHVKRGGGLVISLGDRAADSLEAYNRLLYRNGEGLLPAQLIKKVAAQPDNHFVLQAAEDAFLQPPLKAFAADDDRISLRTGRFRQFIQAQTTEGSKARVVMTFMPEADEPDKAATDLVAPTDAPAIVEWNPPAGAQTPGQPKGPPGGKTLQGKSGGRRQLGKVVLFTSTLNMDWNNWPGSPSYGSMMQEIARLAASGRLQEQAGVVGEPIEAYLPGLVGKKDVTIVFPTSALPSKKTQTQTDPGDDVAYIHWTETEVSGIYRALVAGAEREQLFALNVPATTPDQRGSESDLTRIDLEKIKEKNYQIVSDPRLVHLADSPTTQNSSTERGPVGPYIAYYALLALLVLLFAEVILAWQFGHYSTVEGSPDEPSGVSRRIAVRRSAGLGLALTLTGAAAVVFLFGALVLFETYRTGDFLNFLPESLRLWVEAGLGLPPPPPGESMRWALESIPLFGSGANDSWTVFGLFVAALVLVGILYRAEAPAVSLFYKSLLGSLRIFLILATLCVLLPQLQVRFDRQSWPDLALLIDTSQSMGVPDVYQEDSAKEFVNHLKESFKRQLLSVLPQRISKLEADLAARTAEAASKPKDPAVREAVEAVESRLQDSRKQLSQVDSPNWRPSRLQLVQALLAGTEDDWIQKLLRENRTKVHLFALDVNGRAVKLSDNEGPAGDLIDPANLSALERTRTAVANLDADGTESRLGTAVRQAIDQYRGAPLTAVVMFTDGVTTRDETIGQASEYALQKGIPLFFVGLGEGHEIRDLKLYDLQVEDTVYVKDRVIFEARLAGQGYKDLTVPVVLKVKRPDGKEEEIMRDVVKVDALGKSVRVRLRDQPAEPGRKHYIVEVEAPKLDDQAAQAKRISNLRLERTIEVLENKLIKVLYIEQQPRYEFRFIKALLERESLDVNKARSIDLKVLLLDADPEFPNQDRTAIRDFPATRAELESYDVVILGDCNPAHPQLRNVHLKMLADFVRGEDDKGKKTNKTGGGLLMIAGPFYAPHAYKDTPLADVLPVIPLSAKPPPEPENRPQPLHLELTNVGRLHPVFRFSPDEAENMSIWQRLAPIYWYSSGYTVTPLAEVLAVHPTVKAPLREGLPPTKLPLAVQQFVGSGRTMFFGFEESWRWRLREDEIRFNQFWIQTVRYLSRSRTTWTDLRLDRQTPYRVGEPIKITIRFPDNMPIPGSDKAGTPPEVKVLVEYFPDDKEGPGSVEAQVIQLAKVEGSWATFEGFLNRTRAGRYRFLLNTPDVSRIQAEKPSADAIVENPPGEMDRLRMNQTELAGAAETTGGRFYTLANASDLLRDLPSGTRISVVAPTRSTGDSGSSDGPPVSAGGSVLTSSGKAVLIWNQWPIFLFIVFLFTAEWILRKRKHLL